MANYRLRIGVLQSYTLTAANGSYALSGQAATLTYVAGGDSLSWTAASGATGYFVYWGNSSGVYTQSIGSGFDVGNVTTFTPTQSANYFVVSAYNSAGDESAFSNEVHMVVP